MENRRRPSLRKEYELHPDIQFWKAKDDIRIISNKPGESVRLAPKSSQIIQVELDEDSVLYLDDEFLGDTHASARSRLAQLGFSVSGFGKQLIHNFEVHGESPTSFPFVAQILADNYSHVPVDIPDNIRIFRAYHEKENARIKGEQLKRLKDEGKIFVSGEEGRDWKWKMDRGQTTALLLRIDPASRKWIPPFSGIVSVVDNEEKYREMIDKRLEAIPPYAIERGMLIISEFVSEIAFIQGIDGILDPFIMQNIQGRIRYVGEHVDSYLIDGGKKPWRIREEYLSRSEPEEIHDEWGILYLVAA